MALFVLYNALSRTLQRGEAWRGMVELEHLAAFDCLQWLRTGERAAGVLGISQSTVSRAARERFDAHKAIARWTLPLWLYVSVTGVVIYLLLYQIFPQGK